MINYAVHQAKADGGTRPKVFKGWKLGLSARGEVTLKSRHAVWSITSRHYCVRGRRVVVQLNGRARAESAFALRWS